MIFSSIIFGNFAEKKIELPLKLKIQESASSVPPNGLKNKNKFLIEIAKLEHDIITQKMVLYVFCVFFSLIILDIIFV